jgi:hypothetical protein
VTTPSDQPSFGPAINYVNPALNPGTEAFAQDPVLSMLWQAPPPFTGTAESAAGSGGSAPSSPAVTVDLGTLQAAEQAMLGAESQMVADYSQLTAEVAEAVASDSFFGQQAIYYNNDTSNAEYNHSVSGPQAQPDTGLQTGASDYYAQIAPAMTQVLAMIAATAEALGMFTAAINNAGQAYTFADKSSSIGDAQAQ